MDITLDATRPKFELSNTVTLFTQQATAINSLWATFAAITFVGAGYGLSLTGLGVVQASAITCGFLGFVTGHLILLHQALSVEGAAAKDIRAAIAGNPANELKSLHALCETVATPWKATALHIAVDAFVLIALWSRVPAVAGVFS